MSDKEGYTQEGTGQSAFTCNVLAQAPIHAQHHGLDSIPPPSNTWLLCTQHFLSTQRELSALPASSHPTYSH